MIAYDYSSGAIAPAALLAAGCRMVFRYVSTPGNSKNITSAEYASLVAAGIEVGLVYETTADWMLGGYDAGLAAAHSARQQATAVGYPHDRQIWYAADFGATAAQITTVLDCLHGCADAEGTAALVAVYGGYDTVAAATTAGFRTPWQTLAWSTGRQSSAAAIYQTGQTATVGGVQVDINQVLINPFQRKETEDMILFVQPSGGQNPGQYLQAGPLLVGITDSATAPALQAAGQQMATVDVAFYESFRAAQSAWIQELAQAVATALAPLLTGTGTPAPSAAAIASAVVADEAADLAKG